MSMTLVYPARLQRGPDGYTVTFRDVPGAITCGETPEEALRESADALALILEDILDDGEALPLASAPRRGEKGVTVPPDVAARLLLRHMRDEARLTKAKAADLAGVSRQSWGQMEARGRNLTLKTLGEVATRIGYDVVLDVRPRQSFKSARTATIAKKGSGARRSNRS